MEMFALVEKDVRALFKRDPKLECVLSSTDSGIELHIITPEKLYRLYTERSGIRRFKSENSAIGFVKSLGLQSFKMVGLGDK